MFLARVALRDGGGADRGFKMLVNERKVDQMAGNVLNEHKGETLNTEKITGEH